MKAHFFKIICLIAAISTTFELSAQHKVGSGAEFDRIVHDFGDIMLSDGPQSCTFTVKNTGDKPLAIYSVITTCGCTKVEWTREPIKSGQSGKIKVTYSNDEGAYPFDKTLTTYISASSKPVLLRIRGVVHKKKLSTSEIYTKRMGPLGVKEKDIEAGDLEQGCQKSDVLSIANLGKSAVKLSFSNISQGLGIKGASTIEAGKVADISWTITASRERWGKNMYSADVIADGRKVGTITISASTRENFSRLSKEERVAGARPMFKSSSYCFNRVKAGTIIEPVFEMTNSGKAELEIYKIDCDSPKLTCSKISNTAVGAKKNIKMRLDTSGMPSGEVLILVSLTTNSPLRPVVNLFVTGWIE